MSSNMSVPKICQLCGVEFIARTTTTQYCGDPCAKKAYKNRIRDSKVRAVDPVAFQKKEYNQGLIKEKAFLSISETCKLLGASRMTLYRQIKSGTIRIGKLGGRIIIKKTEIEKLFQS